MAADAPRFFDANDLEASTHRLIAMSVGFNLLIYENAQTNPHMVYRDAKPGGTPLVNIQRVASRQEARFRSIVRQFPHAWPLHEQAAYILRAYSGLQMFPDANHRTGLAVSRVYLRLRSHTIHASLQDWKDLVSTLKDNHSPYWSRCKADVIANRNRCFTHISNFYQKRTRKRSILDIARERLGRRNAYGELAYWEEEPEAEAARKNIPFTDDDPT